MRHLSMKLVTVDIEDGRNGSVDGDRSFTLHERLQLPHWFTAALRLFEYLRELSK
jgi:hypothetical protein